MKIKLYPSVCDGIATTSPSKSITHRAIICASLSKNASTIINPLLADDTIATIKAMSMMGVKFSYDETKKALKVIPPKKLETINNGIDCSESGTTFRFLMPIMQQLQNGATFNLGERLIKRVTDKELCDLKASYIKTENNITFFKKENDDIVLSDHDTTQYISGYLIASAIKGNNSSIRINNTHLNGYIVLTMAVLEDYGVKVKVEKDDNNLNYTKITITDNNFIAPKSYTIEGDFSNGANILVSGLLGNKAICKDLHTKTFQGDSRIIDIIKNIGGNISVGSNIITTSKSNLKPFEISLDENPDLGPLLIGLTTLIEGTSTFYNFHRLIYKESNRVDDTIEILKALGADILEDKNNQRIIVTGKKLLDGGITIDCRGDHRLLFMLFVISNGLTSPIIIENASCYNKSFPNFLKEMNNLGYKFQIEE